MRRVFTVVLATMALIAISVGGAVSASAGGKKVVVGTASKDCKKPDAATISAGVALASPGDTVWVCPGTYTEQVTIPASKNGVELRSARKQAAVIQAPATMTDPKAIVLVDGAAGVTIRDFVITGPGGGGCDSLRYGVRVQGGGSVDIWGNHITKIRDQGNSGCQNGIAVQVGRNFEGQIGSATITDNLIDEYQKGGVVVDGTGSWASLDNNVVRGLGSVNFIAQNGVQVSRGAQAELSNNVISDHLYSPQTYCSIGVLVFDEAATKIKGNSLARNDCSIYLWATSADNEVSHNDISDSTFDGIDLLDVSGAEVHHNKISSSDYSGIYVDSDSMDNTLSQNKIEASTVVDAEDASVGGGTAGTANTWEHNQCATSSPPGLCN